MTNQYDQVNQLLIKLYSQNPEYRRDAVEELSYLVNERVLYRLVEHLDDPNKGVRDAISHILFENAKKYPGIEDQLIRYLFRNDIEIRNLASEILIHIGEAAIEPMKYALRCDDRDVRKFIADIFGFIGSHLAIPYLVEAFEDEDSNVGFSSIEAVGSIGSVDALPALENVITNNADLRAMAIEAVGKISHEKSIEVIKKFLNDEDPMVVYGCIDALGNIHSEKSLETLLNVFSELDDLNKENAVNSIFRVAKEIDIRQINGNIYDVAAMVLDETDEDDLINVLYSFSKIDHPDVLVKMTEYLNERNEELNSVIYEALVNKNFSSEEEITNALENCEGYALDLVINLVGEKGIESAIKKLIDIAEQSGVELKVTVINTLANFHGNKDATDYILKNLQERNENVMLTISTVRALGQMKNEDSFDQLLEMLNSTENEELAFTILETFVNIGSEKSLAFFEEMIQSDDAEYKNIAVQAINEISPEKVKDYLNEFLGSGIDEIISIAINIITENSYNEFQDKLINDLQAAGIDVQKSILDTLAHLDAAGNFDTFIKYLNHEEKWVQVHSLDVLVNQLSNEFLESLEKIDLKSMDEVTKRPLFDFIIVNKANAKALEFIEKNYQYLDEDQEVEFLTSDDFKALDESKKIQFYRLTKLDIEKVTEN